MIGIVNDKKDVKKNLEKAKEKGLTWKEVKEMVKKKTR